MTVALPAAVAAYLAAANTDDADAIAACFAPQGRVHDEKQDHVGRGAIRDWAADTRRRYRFRAEVLDARDAPGETVVSARLTGTFPGSPVELTYRFSVAPDGITSLRIG